MENIELISVVNNQQFVIDRLHQQIVGRDCQIANLMKQRKALENSLKCAIIMLEE